MTTHTPFAAFKALTGTLAGILLSGVLVANAHAAATALGTEPFTLSTKINALPNIMFVLDDSGSMRSDFLPDWAGPYQATVSGVLTVITPPHRFFNGAYNGVAYNPGTYYRPPVMYTNAGALDTTTYPSMIGQGADTGGDGSATTSLPNWRAVKVDGYGIQSTATSNLEGNAFSYTTVAGEYCTSGQLRTCTASATATGSYTFPAKLRWCTTSAMSLDTTGNAGTNCQASNIDTTDVGVTNYTYARMPRPRIATITVTVAGTVTSITVDGQQILSAASVTGGTTTDVATAIKDSINACTLGKVGTVCTVVGYSATSSNNAVTVTAPGAITSTPVITVGTATASATAFSGGNVPGASLFTVITPTVNAYAYPGTASKDPNRVDCAGSTCTYVEEMTNYANWYAYYHTRMQMMKTSSSIAFSSVTDKFRVGYYSINDGAGGQFLNVSAFDGAQKNLWYSKFFSAVPYGVTPLRTGLSNIGRMYAGKVSTLNLEAVNDPMQYSCQQNFTILSTDGYWNDAANPKQIDGTTDIGEQDGNDPRPYYDGATQTRTVSQTTKAEEQTGINTLIVTQRTQQQQTSTSRLLETVVTTDTYPWTTQTTRLQTQTTPLNQTSYSVRQRTYPLTSVTKQLQKSTYTLNSTPRILQSYINNLTKTITPLEARTYNVTRATRTVTKNVYNVTRDTRTVTRNVYNVTRDTRTVTQTDYNVSRATRTVTKNVYNLTSTTSPLQSSTYKIQSSSRQLQKRMETSADGGDTWQDTGWVDAASCTVAASGPGWTRNTTCRYNTAVVANDLNSCTSVAASAGPTSYTVALAVSCAYQATPVVANVGTCTVVAQSGTFAAPQVACAYGTAAAPVSGLLTCTAKNQTGAGTMTGDKVVCAYDATPTTTTGLATCTWVVPSPSASVPKTECSYGSTTNLTNQTTCTAAPAATATTNGAVWNTTVACSEYATPTTTTGLATCTWVVPATAFSATRTACSYGSTTTLANQTTCTAAPAATATTNGAVWNTTVACSEYATPTTTTGLATCTWVVPATAFSASRTACSYGSTTTLANQTTCTAASAATATTNGSVWNTTVACSEYATPTTTTGLATCTWVVPATAFSASRTACSYGSTTTLTNRTTCSAASAASAVTDGSVWDTTVACSYDGSPATTLTNQSSCTWVVPATAASVPRTDCVYNAGAVSTSTVATCTPVAQSTGTTNGTEWAGPATACAYAAAVLTGTNLATCTAGTPSGSAPFLAYTTCGYINGTTTTGLNSCSYVADSTANTYTGPANACAYTGTPVVTNETSCSLVAASATFAAPRNTCAYQGTGSNASNLTTCTDVDQSTGAYPWIGPNVACDYSGTASTDTTVASCTYHESTAPNYTGGAKTRCTYNSGSSSSNVASCNVVAKSTSTADGTAYPTAYDCVYGTTTGWTNATAACVPVAQSGGAAKVGPARECQYTTPSVDTFTATCSVVAQDNTNLTARGCLAGAFPVTVSTVATTVDSCSTAPTSGGAPVVRSTATTCAYQAPVVTNTATCSTAPVSGGTPYSTAVTCPVSDTGFVAVAPTCTPAGTASPVVFDGTGKIVECVTTDTTPYTVAYPSGPVPVATCTAGTNAGTKEQTTCTLLINTGPDPVDPALCTTAAPSAGNDYVRTTCVSTAVPSTVVSCVTQAPTTPLWQTISCAYNADSGTYNTLADVAAYYYKTDLRTVALNNCTGSIVPPATVPNDLCSVAADLNNVPTTTKDPLSTQHMTTFTLGLGASGYMKYSSTYETDTSGDFSTVKGVAPYAAANAIAADPANGVCSWQSTGDCNWPVPVSDEQTAIDDLWHAGVNGHGSYFSATDPVSLGNSIAATLAQVAAAGGAAASPSISNPSLTPGDSYVFSSTYTSSDWTGELVRRQLDPGTAQISTVNDWSVQGKLDSNTARNIYTFDSSVATTKLKPFTSANFAANAYFLSPHIATSPTGLTQYLCASTDTCLSATDQNSSHAAGANLVNFLRGDRTNEGAEKDNTKYYRQRLHVLGDMVNAQVVYVNKPIFSYTDRGYAEETTGFVATNAARSSIVYAGSNDGMLHAFHAKGDATTEALVNASVAATAAAVADPSSADKATAAAAAAASANAAVAADTIIGQELWAYIPTMVMPNLYALADKRYKDKHRYYVDATPVIGDICTSNCATGSIGSAVWKTVLVGGLGRGGRGYYALDITDPANPKALWEFTDTNLGYSYGNPQITKLSNGTWVVLVTSGYNNIANDDGAGGDGQGRLYVINAATGALIQSIATGVGDTTSPSGLAKITARVKDPTYDNTVEAVYGGDLYGNLWRFDVNKTLGEAQLLAVLKDGSSNLQPITTKPEVAMVPKANAIVVYIGTGRFLAAADANDLSQQTIYAIKDPVEAIATATPAATLSTAIYNNPRTLASFIEQIQAEVACPSGTASFICAANSMVRTSTSNTVEFASDTGWYVDLIGTAERANTDLKIALGGLYFNTNAPTLAACDVGGKSYQYFLDYKSGSAVKSPGTNGVVGKFLANELASTITLVMAGDGTMRSISGLSGGGIDVGQPPLPPEAWVTRRTSWRELIRE